MHPIQRLDNLPQDLFSQVLPYLEAKDLTSLCLACLSSSTALPEERTKDLFIQGAKLWKDTLQREIRELFQLHPSPRLDEIEGLIKEELNQEFLTYKVLKKLVAYFLEIPDGRIETLSLSSYSLSSLRKGRRILSFVLDIRRAGVDTLKLIEIKQKVKAIFPQDKIHLNLFPLCTFYYYEQGKWAEYTAMLKAGPLPSLPQQLLAHMISLPLDIEHSLGLGTAEHPLVELLAQNNLLQVKQELRSLEDAEEIFYWVVLLVSSARFELALEYIKESSSSLGNEAAISLLRWTLIEAAKTGRIECIEKLIRQECDKGCSSWYQRYMRNAETESLLIEYAALCGYEELLEFFFLKGSLAPSQLLSFKNLAIEAGVGGGREDSVRYLLGITTNPEERTALASIVAKEALATEENTLNMVKIALEEGGFSHEFLCELLTSAAKQEDGSIVQLLLKNRSFTLEERKEAASHAFDPKMKRLLLSHL